MDGSGISIVHFHVTGNTHFGQSLAICGEGSEFGNWQSRKAIMMKTDDTKYPVWRSERPIMVKKSKFGMSDSRPSDEV